MSGLVDKDNTTVMYIFLWEEIGGDIYNMNKYDTLFTKKKGLSIIIFLLTIYSWKTLWHLMKLRTYHFGLVN